MVPDDLYDLCVPVLEDSAADEEERAEKVEELVKIQSCTGRRERDAGRVSYPSILAGPCMKPSSNPRTQLAPRRRPYDHQVGTQASLGNSLLLSLGIPRCQAWVFLVAQPGQMHFIISSPRTERAIYGFLATTPLRKGPNISCRVAL